MLEQWINDKLADIGTRLPSLVHEDAASFACGYNAGYKRCLLDLVAKLEKKEDGEIDGRI